MRILHLGYEDPRQPGSGGGSVRTREINRRLATRHTISVVVAAYPGARPRVEDNIRWIPIGPRTGGKLDRLAYFALLGIAVKLSPHDLVVEDFGAPFSVGLSPMFTRKPVVASVQWLFAREMRAKYGLPFDWAERAGLRLYDDFVVVSEWLARSIRQARPQADVVVIPNGIAAEAFEVREPPAGHMLFLGRLDVAQKGGDLLLDIFARMLRCLGAHTPPLLVVGDGPGRAVMERWSRELGLESWIHFLGRLDGPEKYRLLSSARALLMPSRFETFGMVAIEALAAGAPVVAFDVGPLAEVAGPGGAYLVPPFDCKAFADIAMGLVQDQASAEQRRRQGQAWARRYDWGAITACQEMVYLKRAEGGGRRW